jgi:hypothetical protein
MTYRKIGGLHYITLGRLGFCWYWQRPKALSTRQAQVELPLDRASSRVQASWGLYR